MKFTLFNKIVASFAAGILLIFFVYLLDYRSTNTLVASFDEVSHSEKILHELETLYSLLKDVQRSHRGYIITRNTRFLDPYKQARISIFPLLDSLGANIQGRPGQQVKFKDLQVMIRQKVAYVENSLAQDQQTSLQDIGKGKQMMDATGKVINAMIGEENQYLLSLHSQVEADTKLNKVVIISGLILTTCIFLFAIIRIAKDIRDKEQLQRQVEIANTELSVFNEELTSTNEHLAVVVEKLEESNKILIENEQKLLATQGALEYRENQLLEAQALTHTGSFDWDIEQNLVTYTPEYARIFRLREDATYQSESLIKLLHSDDKKRVIQSLQNAIENNVSYQVEYRVVHPDTTLHIASTAKVIYEHNKAVRVMGTVVDITERKIAEQQIMASEKRFRALLESAPDAMIIADKKGNITLANAQTKQIFGYANDELLGKPVEILIPEHYRIEHQQHWFQYATNAKVRGMGHGLELYGLKKDGSVFPVEVSLSPIETAEGLSIAAAIRDVTDRKNAQQQLQQYNQALHETNELLKVTNQDLEAFSYSISHDLKTPLRSILSFGSILEEEYGQVLDEEGRRLLGIILRNSRNISELIEALLQFSRLGKKAVNKENLNIDKMVNNLFVELEPELKERKITLEKETNLGIAWADNYLIKQVWINLVNNAVKFTAQKENAQIMIGHRDEESADLYYIRDNGIGFNPSYAQELFGVFKRLHNSGEFAGTGVGLAIVYRIITNHGGKIWAEAEENKGATFYFTLPKKMVHG